MGLLSRKFQLIILLLASPSVSIGQNVADTLARDNKLIPLPTVSLNVGFNHGFTDVPLSEGPSPFRQLGYQLTITQRIAKYLNLSLELFSGSLYGEEQRGTNNLNYRTSLFSQRLNLEYNFYPLLKPKADGRQLIQPYIGFGVGAVFFRSKGDLKDRSGKTYNYWTNGSIYAETEGTVDVSEATQLERDFEYETDLRDANLDGFRKYSQTAFTMPFNAGIRLQLSKHVGLNASFAYVLNFTDMIDNVNAESVGVRAGNSAYDNHLYGSLGLSVFLGATKPSAKPKKQTEPLLADAPAKADSTDAQATVNEEDTSEAEEESASNVTESITVGTSPEGNNEAEIPLVGMDESLTGEEKFDEANDQNTGDEAAKSSHATEVESNETSTEVDDPKNAEVNLIDLANSSPKETGGFHWADLNSNGWISPDEVLHFIDLLFEGEAVRSVSDIQDLIDYYFEQE
ncbi:MAG: hypothetical protein RL266_599 [Bacteroidota bacterium]